MERFEVLRTTWDELEAAGYVSVTDYCRFLVKQPDPLPNRIEVYRGEMLCMTVTDVAEAAKLMVKEDKNTGPIFVKYKDTKMSAETKARLALKHRLQGDG